MRIIHRVATRADEADQRELEALGVVLTRSRLPGERRDFVTFDVAEDSPAWPTVRRDWIGQREAGDIVRTTFTRQELLQAPWHEMVPAWHQGYPQPEDDFGYLAATYDLSGYCRECGIGAVQVAPFRMVGEPKWGGRGILQLNWVFDEYFASPDVWRSVFEPHGVGARPVLNHGTGEELRTVLQLVAADEEVDVVLDGYPSETCPVCGRVKYLPITRGAFPAPRSSPRGTYNKTREYFGSGHAASKRVLTARQVYQDLSSRRIRGAQFGVVGG